MILAIRTQENGDTEIFTLQGEVLTQEITHGHDSVLQGINRVAKPQELKALVLLEGKGSFTHMRSAVVTLNTIAAALRIPVLRSTELPDIALIQAGKRLADGENQFPLTPHYTREPNITMPKKVV